MADGKRSRIERMLERQQADFASLDDASARRMLRALEDARRELADRIRAMEGSGADKATPWTAQQRRVMLAQIEAAAQQIEDRLDEALGASMRAAREQAVKDLIDIIKANEPEFHDTGQRLNVQVLRNLDDPGRLLLAKHSTRRYTADLIGEMQRQLVLGMAQGENIRQLTTRLAGAGDSVFAGKRWRAELIVRMELNAAYNEHHLDALKSAAAVLDEPGRADPLLRRADEFLDRRSHPISWALNGQVVKLDEPWKVKASDVQAWAERVKKRGTGIVWPLQGTEYVGHNYPAHFWERGRQVAFRASWEEQMGRHWQEQHFGAPIPGGVSPPGQTLPSAKPDVRAIPGGAPKRASNKSSDLDRESVRLENQSARRLSVLGYQVEQLLEKGPGRHPDFGIEGRTFDHYAPSTANARNVWSEMKAKVDKIQANRIVLDLSRYAGTREQLFEQFRKWKIGGLMEVLVLDGGNTSWLVR